ncbi:50S ribosomal protein L24 [Blattabacterium cuenoti]|uniref:50S ribosomal protein L24 n=1 Tax=Blattabacterium cuenoti TaxID=1653831 RepID=UPI00163B8B25|nr:50S ribosomal protein L24 [Blattabacterium cuenoti]
MKKGDLVYILSGNNKGKKGTILKVIKKKNKVLIHGINMIKKHLKPNRNNLKGSIVEKEAPIHISNVKKINS